MVAAHDTWWADQVREIAEERSGWVHRLLIHSRKRKPNCLTLEDVVDMAIRSEGRCEVSGVPFNFEVHGKRRPFAPSIDRIDSDKGYSPENTRLVCHAVNVGMNCWGDGPFLRICRALAARDIAKLAGL